MMESYVRGEDEEQYVSRDKFDKVWFVCVWLDMGMYMGIYAVGTCICVLYHRVRCITYLGCTYLCSFPMSVPYLVIVVVHTSCLVGCTTIHVSCQVVHSLELCILQVINTCTYNVCVCDTNMYSRP